MSDEEVDKWWAADYARRFADETTTVEQWTRILSAPNPPPVGYSPMELPALVVCDDCGAVVHDTTAHTVWHCILRDQLRDLEERP